MTPEVNGGESLDRLVGTWSIFQLERGHRFSTDDLVTAWMAWRARPDATRLLDLGSGIGSVGLCTLHKVSREGERGEVRLTTVEAQALSVGLARRTVRYNGLTDRVSVVHGDLRSAAVEVPGGYELITGSPPYFPEGTALLSPHPQKAGARIELRGNVYDYCEAAARWLAPNGRFVFVMAAADPRTEAAPISAGLRVEKRLDVVFGRGREPLVCVLVCGFAHDVPDERETERLVVRGEDGEWTEEYLAFRRLFSFTRPQPS